MKIPEADYSELKPLAAPAIIAGIALLIVFLTRPKPEEPVEQRIRWPLLD